MNLKNVLIVKLSAIGDVVHALPVAHAIKETYHEARITWVTELPALDLVKNNPCIDEVILFEKKKFKSIGGFLKNYPPLYKKLNSQKYDAVLDLQGLFKSAAIAFTAKSAVKLGTANMREQSDKVSKPVVGKNADGHIVERYLDVARALGCEVKKTVFPLGISDWEKSQAEKMLAQAGAKNNPYVFIAVGANWPNKRWPVRYMAKLCDWIYEQNIVPVLGGHGEIDERLASEVGRLAEIPPVSIVGRTPLRQLAHLLKNARLVLGGDTGTVHLAAAAGARVIMLMGPTDAARNGPYGQIENAIEADYACRHCWERSCKFNRECLEKITVEDVIKKMEPMLK